MRLTVFTSSQPRHLALLRDLRVHGPVRAVIEPKSLVPGGSDPALRAYWERVQAAEREVFGDPAVPAGVLIVPMGELSVVPLDRLPLDGADRIIVFGSSWIRGPLADRLLDRGALNLHGGLAPYYRGAAPNFWALYDDLRQYVGAQVQRLSATLDAGEILATTKPGTYATGDPFVAGMRAIRHGIDLIDILLGTPEPWEIVAPNDRAGEIAYHRGADFTARHAAEVMARFPGALS